MCWVRFFPCPLANAECPFKVSSTFLKVARGAIVSKDGINLDGEKINMKKNNTVVIAKSKYWATILYDVKDIVELDNALKMFHLPCILSPLHNKDVKEHIDIINGHTYKSLRDKEPHYHLQVKFSNAVSKKSLFYLLEHKLPAGVHYKGAELLLTENSEHGYSRYLVHMDNPEKAQYSADYICYYGGYNASVLESPKKDNTDKYNDLTFFIQLIHDYRIEDMMTMYEVVQMLCPVKLPIFLRYKRDLEIFTRGQYQKTLRENRIKDMV